jgi:hypothetical protein
MDQARELADLDDNTLRTRVKTSKIQIATTYRPILNALLAATHPQTPEQVAAAAHLDLDVVKARLDSITKADPKVLEATAEYLPDADVMIDFVERSMGVPISQANLADSNLVCSRLVDERVVPRHLSFLRRKLPPHLDAADHVNIALPDLVEFLRKEYVPFVDSQNQGLISRAGRLNERLIRRAMLNAGFVEVTDFQMTGTKSQGDIIVRTTAGGGHPLSIEVKSYGARERLLRGLADADAPKIGVGFFNSASEFNDSRTTDFLGTGALAIYLPPTTLARVDAVARTRVNSRNSVFYRPLTQLTTDLLDFKARGLAAY